MFVHSYLLKHIFLRKSSASEWRKFILLATSVAYFRNIKVIKFSHSTDFREHFLIIQGDFSFFCLRIVADYWWNYESNISKSISNMQIYFISKLPCKYFVSTRMICKRTPF